MAGTTGLPSLRGEAGRRNGLEGLCPLHAPLQHRGRRYPLRHHARPTAFCLSTPRPKATVAPDLAFNTAISFITNTNWQNYGGESTMSYFTQMAGLAVHNFLSRSQRHGHPGGFFPGLYPQANRKLGNFWVDMTRTTLYILLPFSFVMRLSLDPTGHAPNLRVLSHGHLGSADLL